MYNILPLVILCVSSVNGVLLNNSEIHIFKGKIHPITYEEFENQYEGKAKLNHKLRNDSLESALLWDNGIVPYEITADFTKKEHTILQQVMDLYRQYTCINFLPRTTEVIYVKIDNIYSSCYSNVGKDPDGGINLLNFGSHCFHKIGYIIHELMHTVGFNHEHNRYDRDDYVTINWSMIKSSRISYFKTTDSVTYDLPYDYDSVMHYDPYAFSIFGRKSGEAGMTIIPKDMKNLYRLGQSRVKYAAASGLDDSGNNALCMYAIDSGVILHIPDDVI
ncbi:unnamed protein product [Diabrotica balteata]|uniref:Metalloendopeptidase n=1 Tax=Diabrotica balteata TaxID=107213 RepID=A0A9N9XIB3_DIABA|nr:unnamed protein product [Diabrotica balteata]